VYRENQLIEVLSGTQADFDQCPLLEVKPTSARHCPMSAFDPKRTSASLGHREKSQTKKELSIGSDDLGL
jgi:hypothetical protein